MFRHVSAWLTLICYSAVALAGQGLHLVAHEHGVVDIGPSDSTVATVVGQQNAIAVASETADEHDAEHCSICQHHSLGQIFVAVPPVEILLAVCELASFSAPELIVCPALYAVSQPRAPPLV